MNPDLLWVLGLLAGAVTLFTEPGATVGAPPLEGPTMYEWIQLLRGERDAVSPTTATRFAVRSRSTSCSRATTPSARIRRWGCGSACRPTAR